MKQSSGNDSTNIQAAGNVVIGLSYEDASKIALDVFKANFFEFSQKASEIALQRAEEITRDFIAKFYDEIPHLTAKLEEPSVQSSLFNAQKEYAKTGDKELELQLLDLLIERVNSEERSLKQIVLDEALLVLPKLTNEQISIMSLVFSAILLNHREVVNVPAFVKHFQTLLTFYPDDTSNYSFYTHLQFTGCCAILPEGATYKPLNEFFKIRYKGLFTKGTSEAVMKDRFQAELVKFKSLLITCLRNPTLLQIDALNESVLDNRLSELNLVDHKPQLLAVWNESLMSDEEIKQILIDIDIKAAKLLEDWQSTDLKTIKLTSVGIAIAILNYNKKTGADISLTSFI